MSRQDSALSLHYLDSGEPEGNTQNTLPLVVVHGLLGSADNWRSHLKVWQASRRVIAVDLRNHGRSPHAKGMSYQEMSGDVLALLDQLGIEQAHLLGHSMGGKVVISVARLAPQRVASLLVADIAPVAYSHGHDRVFAGLRRLEAGKPKNRREADELLAEHVEERAVRLFLATNLVRNDEEGALTLRIGLDEIIEGYPDLMQLPAGNQPYEGPTLILRGANSDYVTDEMLPATREMLPRTRVVTLKNAGHWLHAEQSEAFQEAVRVFLAAQSDSA
ncbi:alpha/beta fold hydrolase [Halomonas sp. ZH2S]|uniref:Alpha/beta fold hydrolase n=1 Tax=Vreelandella zhuhanensis TaxID=2684210 RepID=A0A7X3KRQ1_9GAMM|nr:alpha/beta fold hydrolase [Halomonas zhuhanensis]MWJ28591.1 alpha/beta fold hydrolase [Halomonas zhuhanensis]